MHECPRCGYDGHEDNFDGLDPDVYCLKHGKPLLDGMYGFKASNCDDCEPGDDDGECFRGGEAAAYEREQMDAWRGVK